jgi:Tfp pilus assembly protein PilN
MRAVNLIPSDQRGGASVGAGRSEGAAYAVLGLLLAVAVLAVLYGKANHSISSNKSKAAALTAEAQHAQAEAQQLAPYTSFVSLREQREQAVARLVDTRFDWAHAFHEFGRVLTDQVSISSLSGSIAAPTPSSIAAPAASAAPASSSSSASSSTTSTASTPAAAGASAATAAASTATSATPEGSIPTFTIAGCATSQRAVAQTMERLRLIDGVSEVTLSSSTRGGGSGSASGSCAATDPVFQLSVTFEPLPAAATSASAVSSTAKTVATSPSTATPAPTSGGAG